MQINPIALMLWVLLGLCGFLSDGIKGAVLWAAIGISVSMLISLIGFFCRAYKELQ